MGVNVVRPTISGLMGAYGAAMYAQSKSEGSAEGSTLLKKPDLENFVHEIKVVNCGMCNNNCRLTVNTFADGSSNNCCRNIRRPYRVDVQETDGGEGQW